MTAEKIAKIINEWSPECCAEEWDNVGLLIGDAAQPVRKVLVALDATEAVIGEAVAGNFDFIITHHPLIYDPLKKITSADPTGRKILTLIRNNIGLYCAHTNLDKAPGGVNDCLAEKLSLNKITPLIPETQNESFFEGGSGETFFSKKVS
ncbi:MAG: Nif3-like dinuclear metal center hexameric protein, partial [Defluviitaleaceae bacterium]|nr:Nif3-like dinuclear metal center hexameric protein [Defluviitaleaceae bacterium]